MYTSANVEKMANSQVRFDARSDYSDNPLTCIHWVHSWRPALLCCWMLSAVPIQQPNFILFSRVRLGLSVQGQNIARWVSQDSHGLPAVTCSAARPWLWASNPQCSCPHTPYPDTTNRHNAPYKILMIPSQFFFSAPFSSLFRALCNMLSDQLCQPHWQRAAPF